TIADVTALAVLAREFGAWLVIDEAHATGVLGPRGAGVCADAGLAWEANVVKVVTFSKALGASGGAVCGSAAVRQLLLQRARALMYPTGLAHPVVAAATAALDVLRDEPEHRARLATNTVLLHELVDRIADSGHACALPMVPITVGSARRAMQL